MSASRSSGRSTRSIRVTGASTGSAFSSQPGNSASQLSRSVAGRRRPASSKSFLTCATMATKRSLSSRARPSGIALSLRESKGW
eukprot:scaffold69892_cov71-Phaeocystis_antarctica.AAC.5